MTSLSGRIAAPDGRTFTGQIDFSDRILALKEGRQASSDLILPGCIDLQVNGANGIDVLQASAEALGHLAFQLASEGTTAFLPTAITSPITRIARVHEAIAEAIDNQARAFRSGSQQPATAAILGMHCEGPFISPLRRGVHPPPDPGFTEREVEQFLALEHLRIITLAPELPGALDIIRRFIARGCVVSLGHSDATYEQAQAAIDAGARLFTHLFNAMRPLHHREPGIVGVALLATDAMAALIADGVHIDPAILKLVYRLRGAAGIILTTDRVVLAASKGANETESFAGLREESGAMRNRGGRLAGSKISMLDGLRRMVRGVGVPVAEAAMMCATNPARLLGLHERGTIAPGAIADLVVLDRDLALKAVFIAGRQIR